MVSENKILNILQELADYYSKEPSDAQVQIYLRTIGNYDARILQAAADRWVKKSPFYPKVNELIKLAEEIQQDDPEWIREQNRKLYWSAQGLFTKYLGGVIGRNELEGHSTWKWFVKQYGYELPIVEMVEA